MTQKKTVDLCPCGSQILYEQCCENYISGRTIPETPEALMRSRYTAYVQENILYIQDTMRENASEDFNQHAVHDHRSRIKWKRLKVKNTFSHCNKGYVEFIAHGISEGKPQKLHEISEFKKIDGKWYYVDRVLEKKFDELVS